MRVLVTGGLGFLGHAAVRALSAAGHVPVAVSSRRGARSLVEGVETVHADLRDRDAVGRVVAATQPEAVFHLAALTRVRDSFDGPELYFAVNVAGTAALLEALSSAGSVPVVFASTGAVYGSCEGHIREDQPTAPTNPYGESKVAAEQLLVAHAAATGAPVVILRCFNVAGAVDGVGDVDRSRIIPKALAVAAGVADRLTINGDGTAVREFTHVADVASAMVTGLAGAAPGPARIFNVGSGVESTMLDLVEVAERVTGRPVAVEHRPAAMEPKVVVADSSRIRAELGWRPACPSLEEIVADAWGAVQATTAPR